MVDPTLRHLRGGMPTISEVVNWVEHWDRVKDLVRQVEEVPHSVIIAVERGIGAYRAHDKDESMKQLKFAKKVVQECSKRPLCVKATGISAEYIKKDLENHFQEAERLIMRNAPPDEVEEEVERIADKLWDYGMNFAFLRIMQRRYR